MTNFKINKIMIKETTRTVKRPRNVSIIERYEEDEEAPENNESEYVEYVTPAHYRFQIRCESMNDWDEITIEGVLFVMRPNGVLHQKIKFRTYGELSELESDGLAIIEKLYELQNA
jgi:hypothetical protein